MDSATAGAQTLRGGAWWARLARAPLGRPAPPAGKVAPLWSIVILAAALWLAYGRPYLGYDALFSLVWGSELVHGRTPVFDRPGYPTPHPLANVVAGLLTPLGDGAPVALELLTLTAFAVLGWATYLLASRLFSAPVGIVAAAIILTRPPLVKLALLGSLDIPFLALVVGAVAIASRGRRGAVPVLVLLGLAGLLRPEGWLLSTGYALYLIAAGGRRHVIALLSAAVAAPLVWTVFDLLVTGDPLHSFHGARDFTERTETGGSLASTLIAAPKNLAGILSPPVFIGCALGLIVAARSFRDRLALPLAFGGLGVGAFLVLGFAGLPLYTRYLLVPATMLSLFFGVALLTRRAWSPGGGPGRVPAGIAAGAGALLLASVPGDGERLFFLRERAAEVRATQDDLVRLAAGTAFGARARGCQPLRIDDRRYWPLLALELDRSPDTIVADPPAAPARGLVLRLRESDPQKDQFRERPKPPPPGFRPVFANRSWAMYERCERG